jgi:hypothetical protein
MLIVYRAARRKSINFCALHSEIYDPCTHFAVTQVDPRDRDRQFESPGSGASGVDKKHAIFSRQVWFVGMTAHHGLKTGDGTRVQLIHVMDNADPDAIDLKLQDFRDVVRPRRSIIVTANGNHGSKQLERLKNLGFADVAGMDDKIASSKRGERLRPHQTMSVGDKPDLPRFNRQVFMRRSHDVDLT